MKRKPRDWMKEKTEGGRWRAIAAMLERALETGKRSDLPWGQPSTSWELAPTTYLCFLTARDEEMKRHLEWFLQQWRARRGAVWQSGFYAFSGTRLPAEGRILACCWLATLADDGFFNSEEFARKGKGK